MYRLKNTLILIRFPLTILAIGLLVAFGLPLAQSALAGNPFKLKRGLDYARLDPAHRQDLEHDERVIAEARARPDKPPKLGRVERSSDPNYREEIRTGIIEGGGWGMTSTFTPQNRWLKFVNGELLVVLAGYTKNTVNDERKGQVVVLTRSVDQYNYTKETTSYSTHFTPVDAGPVKIY